MVTVVASHKVMRLMVSPAKGLGVGGVAGDAGSLLEAFHAGGPGRWAAEEDIALGEVRDPLLQAALLVGGEPEDGGRRRARAGQVDDLEPLLGGEDLELVGEQRLGAVALEDEGFARGVVQT